MDIKTLIDQNRLDYCVKLVNDGFVHIGTIWDVCDIYYDHEGDYTYEVEFASDMQEYKVYGYAGKYKYALSYKTKQEIFDPLCYKFYIEDGKGRCTGEYSHCIINNKDDLLTDCYYRNRTEG